MNGEVHCTDLNMTAVREGTGETTPWKPGYGDKCRDDKKVDTGSVGEILNYLSIKQITFMDMLKRNENRTNVL